LFLSDELDTNIDATVSTACLPPYDIRRSQEIIEATNKEIKELESSFTTRKKFSFGNKAKASVTAAPPAAVASTSTTSGVSATSSSSSSSSANRLPPGSFEISNKQNEIILLKEKPLDKIEGGVEFHDRIQLFFKNNSGCQVTM
jgi:hypothetical protein